MRSLTLADEYSSANTRNHAITGDTLSIMWKTGKDSPFNDDDDVHMYPTTVLTPERSKAANPNHHNESINCHNDDLLNVCSTPKRQRTLSTNSV